MASANGSGRLTPAQLAREEKKRLQKAKRLARKKAVAESAKALPRLGARILY